MILGFISFGLLLGIELFKLEGDYLRMFEFAHVWIFVIAILFVASAIVFMVPLSARPPFPFPIDATNLSAQQVSGQANRHWHLTDKMKVFDLIHRCARDFVFSCGWTNNEWIAERENRPTDHALDGFLPALDTLH